MNNRSHHKAMKEHTKQKRSKQNPFIPTSNMNTGKRREKTRAFGSNWLIRGREDAYLYPQIVKKRAKREN